MSLPAAAAAILRALLPDAEREEVLEEIAREYGDRRRDDGPVAARVWLWRQVIGSVPALLRRGWWRGWTGFEPRANWLRPGGPMFESWIMDARYACRRLVSRPAFTAMAVLTLALGAGGTAAVFSVVRALLLEPLPIEHEEQVGVFWFEGSWTEREITRLRPQFPGFTRVAGWKPGDMTLEVAGESVRIVPGVIVTADLFEVLDRGAMLGRAFQTGDDLRGAGPSVVLSHALWRDLGGDPGIVGRQLILGGIPRVVRGVMPPGFWFPTPAVRMWVVPALNPQRGVGEYTLIGRVADGRSLDAMQAPLAQIAKTLAAEFRYPPQWDKTRSPALTPVREFVLGDVRPGIVATFSAMGLILLIACVNVTTLMLGQAGGRTTEIALRMALGAGRDRLLQQLTIEALVLGSLAGLLGAAAAAGGFGLLVRSLPLGALAETTTLDWTVFWTSLAVALGASLAIALIVAVVWWRGTLREALATTRTRGVSVRGGRFESGLVIAQVGLAVVLAIGAGLLIRSASKLRAIDPGTDVSAVGVLDVSVPARLTPDERRAAYFSLLDRLRAVPGVRGAAVTQKLPLRGPGDNWGMTIPGRPQFNGQSTFVRVVSDTYFETLGIAVRRGRGFVPADRASTHRVVVVNEAFAAKFFAGEDPVGHMLNGVGEAGERIIGVVESVAERDLTDEALPTRYMLYDQIGDAVMSGATFVLRTDSPAALPSVLQDTRGTLQREAPQMAVRAVTTMQAVFDKAVGPTGQVVTLVSLLAGLALILGAIGIYGVMTHFVSRRLRDYGICMMLGLAPRQVLARVVRRGAVIVALGCLVGLGAAAGLTRLLSSLLYDVAPVDAPAFVGAALTLLLVGTAAALVPGLRASATDPAALLRHE